jgi:hypothetical protein
LELTFRLITFSRDHLADDLLNTYLSSTTNLQQLLSLKNAQMEVQNDDEAALYLEGLNETMSIIIDEIKNSVDFNNQEISRIHYNASIVFASVKNLGEERK